MEIVREVAAAMQRVLGPEVEELGRTSRLIQRQRKFSAVSLLRMLVLTLLKKPRSMIRRERRWCRQGRSTAPPRFGRHTASAPILDWIVGLVVRPRIRLHYEKEPGQAASWELLELIVRVEIFSTGVVATGVGPRQVGGSCRLKTVLGLRGPRQRL